MPIYRFTIDDGKGAPQPEPVELPSITHARSQAAILAGQLLHDADGEFWKNSNWRVDVRDENNLILSTILISGFDGAAARR
ncbi:DUF6894 family protein [Sphingomonas beigongshangi]|uniref:DUF6894 family protein n=1 Tax=Sphingomonas beigongshangi TaxID=2782540 RepID=UPI003D0DC8F7